MRSMVMRSGSAPTQRKLRMDKSVSFMASPSFEWSTRALLAEEARAPSQHGTSMHESSKRRATLARVFPRETP